MKLRIKTLSTLGAAAIVAASLGGCIQGHYASSSSGAGMTIESTTWSPKTVMLTDTRTGETIWSVDIPVGQAAKVVYSEGTGPNEYLPDEVRWELAPIGRRIITPTNRQPIPPATARLEQLLIRDAPEEVGANPDPRWKEKSIYE